MYVCMYVRVCIQDMYKRVDTKVNILFRRDESSFPSDRPLGWGFMLITLRTGLSLKFLVSLCLPLLHKRFQITLVKSGVYGKLIARVLSLSVFSLLDFGPFLCAIPSRKSAHYSL